jgi:transposase-like protein
MMHFQRLRWPKGLRCPKCSAGDVKYLTGPQRHCRRCRHEFNILRDTIFAYSKISLGTWYRAIFLATSREDGITSMEMATLLAVNQSNAWHIIRRLQEAMDTADFRREQS